ncbi:alpha/beta fold hydrolase [Nocardia terpenica]|uniref:Haloalkane dehalogenase n=1 Tax=Nocardia terpenica TaxID=455432 RepID=A0A161Z6L1_9NOCA|nr:alpha/beta fold hydrolase [Nocardia terpenica]KZM75644.1 haloalkane dehalogenase [Nocardia terpenica]NQE86139.1 alpha/beta fold hydrolase [Nocardia terpenica]
MIDATETFDGTWPFAASFTEAAGFRQHYIDVGPRDAEPIVLLHGEPTWGYLWRHLIGPLSRTRRVIVPDHMGFGKSATPADRDYLAVEHVDNLDVLLAHELDLTGITLVMHDWGGPIGTGFALRHPDRVARIFATNTVVPLGLPGYDELMAANIADSSWFRWAAAAHADGTLEQILGNAGSTVCHLMLALQTIARPEIITPTWVRAYSSHFTGPAECRGVLRFPQQLVAPDPNAAPAAPNPEAVAALCAKPAILVEGMRDTALLPRHIIPAFRLAYPHAPIIELPHSGHFTPEDAPHELLAALELFLHSS